MTSLEALRRLPKFPATTHLIETKVKCEICQESFILGEEICALPCIHQFHTNCILKWLESSRSCPICRHEVGPARTPREREQERFRRNNRVTHEELELNMVYGLLLDEWEEDERRREADDAAITIALLQDVGTVPAEFGSSDSDTGFPVVAERTTAASQNTRPIVKSNNFVRPPPPPTVIALNGGQGSRRRVSIAPPMVGPGDPVVDDGSNHPSMDDPSIIFSGDNPVQVSQPPATSVSSTAPSTATPQSVPNGASANQPAPAALPNPAPALPPLIDNTPAPSPQNQPEISWWADQPQAHQPRYRPPQNTNSWAGPIVSPMPGYSRSATQPASWGNQSAPAAQAPNPHDPYGVVSILATQPNAPAQPATSNFDPWALYNDPSHPVNRNRQGTPQHVSPYSWAPIFQPPPPPPPPPVEPPPLPPLPPPEPEPTPPQTQTIAGPLPTITAIDARPPPIITPQNAPPPTFPPPLNRVPSQNNSTPLQEQPNPLVPPPLVPCPPQPPPPPQIPPPNGAAPQAIPSPPIPPPPTIRAPPPPLSGSGLTLPPPTIPPSVQPIPISIQISTERASTTEVAPSIPIPPPPIIITTTPTQPTPQPEPPLQPPPQQQPEPPKQESQAQSQAQLQVPEPPPPPPVSHSDRQPHATLPPVITPPTPPAPPPPPPVPEQTAPAQGPGTDEELEFRLDYLPLVGIAAIFFYAFSSTGGIFLAALLWWYQFRYLPSQRRQ